jgi:hypothetical protein
LHFIKESWKDNNIFDYITTNITYTSKETIASSMYYQLAIGITIGVVTLGVILVSGNYINAKTFFDQYNKRIYIENKPTLDHEEADQEESSQETDQEESSQEALLGESADQELSEESTDESDQELSHQESTDESDQEESEILSEESDQESDEELEPVNQETLVFSINTDDDKK